ncbi:MAG: CoA pyrophosphatase [Giesbergeria sp.]|nr:CoA pyrophosphatase [Giesbergeria sp.]
MPSGSPPIAPFALPQFDPRTVPVLSTDTHLPAIAANRTTPEALRARFASPPVWQPEIAGELSFSARVPARAAVLIALVQRSEPTVLLTERTLHLSTHSGQVAFPGGRVDEGDANSVAAALREAHEEVGLEPRCAEVLGELPVYVTGSSFIISPVVALVAPDCALRPNPYEVARVFEVPLAFLLNPAHHRRHAFEFRGVRRKWYSMPYRDAAGYEHFIWGATAGMLRNFYGFLAA